MAHRVDLNGESLAKLARGLVGMDTRVFANEMEHLRVHPVSVSKTHQATSETAGLCEQV